MHWTSCSMLLLSEMTQLIFGAAAGRGVRSFGGMLLGGLREQPASIVLVDPAMVSHVFSQHNPNAGGHVAAGGRGCGGRGVQLVKGHQTDYLSY